MTQLFQNLLLAHITTGLLGLVGFYAAWMILLGERPGMLKFLKFSTLIGWLMLIASWITGGYYYSKYYGAQVKPVIVSGDYSWAHKIVMEAKEHIFLLLPILALVVTLVVWMAGAGIWEERRLKGSATALAGLVVVLGILITLSGVVISGAVR